MITIFIIAYLVIYIILFTLLAVCNISEFWMDKYFGAIGQNVLIAMFFIPLLITLLWLYNWDCDSNYIEYDNRNHITINKAK